MAENLTLSALGFLITLTVLSGCANKPQELEISTTPIEKPQLVLPQLDQITTRPVEWIVITPENVETVFEDLRKNNQRVVVFAITADGYENISLNLNDIRTYIQQQQLIVAAYNQYYQESESALDAANKQLSTN